MADPPASADTPLPSGAFLLSATQLEVLPERFCPHCGTFYHSEELRFCSRDGTPLDEIDRSRDMGLESLTGHTVADKFILKRQLGAGGMGAVYLAVQKPMGREVAVKVIYRHLTSDPRMVERALREAEAANQVDHPNVVTIYDSGRTQDGLVYVAMEYLRGEDLGQLLLREGPLDPARALRLWLPAVRAMATAHRKGVVHRDLKPDNLFVATRRNEEGETPRDEEVVKVVDFGIAKLRKSEVQRTSASGIMGTLRYMAPEQLQGLEAGPQADVYALALILVELLTGKLPWPMEEQPPARIAFDATVATAQQTEGQDGTFLGTFLRLTQPPQPLRELRPELPASAELQALVDGALALDPTARPQDAGELLRQVLRVPELGGPGEADAEVGDEAAATAGPGVCPFPGLESFDEQQARFFCGRDEEIRQALARLGRTAEGERRWLQVEGASGAGKSSLARAGLIPAALHGQAAGAPPFSAVAVLRPGRDPVHSLAQALAPALGLAAAEILARLRAAEDGLRALLAERVAPGQGFLLLVDQLEEALVQAEGEALRAFDALLAEALGAPGPLYLVTTIRSDLLARFQALPRLEARLNEAARFYLRPMQEEGLRQAILEPARLAGLWWDKGLAERIVADAREAEGSLPLLGHVLRAMWELRSGRRLTRAAYDQLGGVSGALTRSADGMLECLSQEARERARRLFLRLVKIGRGTPDTRQAVPRAEALRLLGEGREAEALLLRLSGARDPAEGPPLPRLIVVDGDGDEAKVDLVHEALLHRWQTLREWIAQDRKTLERRDDLEATAQVWEAMGHPEGGLPQGGLLAYYQGAGLDERQRESLDLLSSERARRFLAEARELERRKELERRRRLQRTIAVLSGFLILMAVMAGFAFAQRQRARRQQARAERRLREAVAGANRIIGVVDHDLRPLAGTTEVRRSLLVAVGDLLENLLADAQHDPALLRSRLLSRLQRGDLARTHEETKQAQAEYEGALQIAEQLVALYPDNAVYRLDLAQCHQHLGDVAFAAGRVPETEAAFKRYLELARKLLAMSPGSRPYRLELGKALTRMGALLARTGNLPRAREHYREGRQLLEALLKEAPQNTEYRHALAEAEERLGESLTKGGDLDRARAALERALQLTQGLLKAEPLNSDYSRTLGTGYTRLGALHLDAGRLAEAEAAYQRSREVYEELLQADPESAAYKQALASTFRAMGDIAQRAGELGRARQHYEACLRLRQELARVDPQNAAYQQGISTIYGALGDLASKAGQLGEARAAYEQALVMRKRIADADPQNAYSRQRLAFAYLALGDVAEKEGKAGEAEAHYRAALVLRQGLLSADPKNARYRQEVGAVQSKLGAVATSLGRAEEAAAAHADALRVLGELVQEYPQNASYRQELATAHSRRGETALRAGRTQEAQQAFLEALNLRQALVAVDAKNAEWQRDLLLAHLQLARIAGRAQRRSHVGAARTLLEQLSAAGLLQGDQEIERAREAVTELRRR